MRRVMAIVALWTTQCLAEQPILRFSITESWSMPLIRIEHEQPVEGILFDLIQAIARETGITPEYHVLARLRLQDAVENGSIDVRCYVSTQWLTNRPGDYIWSIPLIEQRDLLIGRPGESSPVAPQALPPQAIGTVLGYDYPTLAPLFAQGQLQREDSRNQLLVMQKLHVGRYRHAVTNQLSLQWFNRQLPAEQRLQVLAVLQEQGLGCMVRSDPNLPTQSVLRALVRLKQSGEVDRIIERYTRSEPEATKLPSIAAPQNLRPVTPHARPPTAAQ